VNPALGPFAIAALLLMIGGIAKAVRPGDTAVAVEAMGLPGGDTAVRLGGCVEVVLGLAALITVDVPIAVLVAISYAAFCGFVSIALARRLPIASCGCFGRTDTPPSWLHVGITAGACVAAIGMTLDATDSPIDLATGHGASSAAYVVLVVAGVLTSFALLTVIPRSRSSSPSMA
jgi:hypothetical protein